jgi:hypothetical protein
MSREIEISMMGELTFFLGLQIKQTCEGMFVHQGKYTKNVLNKFDMGEANPPSTSSSRFACACAFSLRHARLIVKPSSGFLGTFISHPNLVFGF